jgi:hypothetical protein
MMKAVRFDEYGGVDVLTVTDVPQPEPEAGEVLVKVRAAGINPGEAKIRDGLLAERWPATFPSGEGSDLAGVVERLGEGVTAVAVGDEVIGWVDTRSSHAEYVVVDAENLTPRPAGVPWEAAGGLPIAGFTAWAAVEAVALRPGDTVVVSGAAGGVGSIAVQLARHAGATVIGLAGESNRGWLEARGVIHVTYGDGVAARSESVRTSNVWPYGSSRACPARDPLGSASRSLTEAQPRGCCPVPVTRTQSSPACRAASAAMDAAVSSPTTAASSRLRPEAARKDSRRMPRSKPRKFSTYPSAGARSSRSGLSSWAIFPPGRKMATWSPTLMASSTSWVTSTTVLCSSA